MTHEYILCESCNSFNAQYSVNINQMDGNDSLYSDCSSSSDDLVFDVESNHITVIIGFRPAKPRLNVAVRFPRCLTTIRRDNKTIQSLSLPVISSYNMRSLFPKLNSFVDDFNDRGIGVSFLSEIWEKSNNKKHQEKLQEMLETKGILYISTPRPGLKRGGGVAIAADPLKFSLSKFNVHIPHNLEVSWALVASLKYCAVHSILLLTPKRSPNLLSNSLQPFKIFSWIILVQECLLLVTATI